MSRTTRNGGKVEATVDRFAAAGTNTNAKIGGKGARVARLRESSVGAEGRPSTWTAGAEECAVGSSSEHSSAEAEGRATVDQNSSGGDPERVVGVEIHPGLKHRQTIDGQVSAAAPGERGTGQDDVQWTAGKTGERSGDAEEHHR